MYNQTEVRQFNFVVNGKNMTNRQDLKITAHRCLVNCEEEEIEEVEEEEISSDFIYWSDLGSWESGSLPVDGEDVEILPGVNMYLDIDTPMLNKLTINGRLTLPSNEETPTTVSIHAKIIYVRQGELLAGTETVPYNGNINIILYGEPTDETIAYNVFVETGNKVLAIVGTVKLYGLPRDRMSRLKAVALRTDISVYVATNLDWVAGDQVALLPTAT